MHSDSRISFSVVIPVYNGSASICRAIDSVLAQSYAPLQIIVCDDGSTDSTVALLRNTYGDRITLLKAAKNGGSAKARNMGVEASQGDYIAFLDADDEWNTEKLLLCANALQKLPNARLLFHQYRIVTERQPDMAAIIAPVALPFYRLLRGNCIVTSCAVLKAGIGLRFNEEMRHTEDYDLWLRVAYGGLVYSLPNVLTVLHRPVTTPGGISQNIWAMRKGEMRAYAHLVRMNMVWIVFLPLLWTYSLVKHLVRAVGIMKKGVSYSTVHKS